jgi:hypothetical protein
MAKHSKMIWKRPRGTDADRLFQKIIDEIDGEMAKISEQICSGGYAIDEYKFFSGLLKGYSLSRKYFLDRLTEKEVEDPETEK